MSFVFFISLLNIALVYIYQSAFSQSSGNSFAEIEGSNFFLVLRDWALAGSLGGYAYGTSRFFGSNFTNITTLDSSMNNITSSNPNSISLDCKLGVLDISKDYCYYGLILKDFPSAYTFFMFEQSLNNYSSFYKAITHCQGKRNCTVTYSSDWFLPKADAYIKGTGGHQQHNLYLKYHCKDVKLDYFGYSVSKSTMNNAVVAINGFLLFAFLFYLLCWSIYEDRIFTQFIQDHPHPSDYTIKLKNLPQNLKEEDLAKKLLDHFKNHARYVGLKEGNLVISIAFAQNNRIIQISNELKQQQKKIKEITASLAKEDNFKLPDDGTPLDSKYYLSYVEQNKSKFSVKKVADEGKKLEKILKKKEELMTQKEKVENKKFSFQSAFITFNTTAIRQQFFERMNITLLKKIGLKCLGSTENNKGLGHINVFDKVILEAQNAPEPINIDWNNLQISPLRKKLTRIFFWMLTIGIMAIPIVGVYFISLNLKQNEGLKINCPENSPFTQKGQVLTKAIESILIKDFVKKDSENLMFCYCYADFKQRLNQ